MQRAIAANPSVERASTAVLTAQALLSQARAATMPTVDGRRLGDRPRRRPRLQRQHRAAAGAVAVRRLGGDAGAGDGAVGGPRPGRRPGGRRQPGRRRRAAPGRGGGGRGLPPDSQRQAAAGGERAGTRHRVGPARVRTRPPRRRRRQPAERAARRAGARGERGARRTFPAGGGAGPGGARAADGGRRPDGRDRGAGVRDAGRGRRVVAARPHRHQAVRRADRRRRAGRGRLVEGLGAPGAGVVRAAVHHAVRPLPAARHVAGGGGGGHPDLGQRPARRGARRSARPICCRPASTGAKASCAPAPACAPPG